MCAAASAAGRQIRIGSTRKGQDGRNQREAEDEKQHDAEKTSHPAIVAKLCHKFVTAIVQQDTRS
jgi:hypothetical protein